VSQERLPHCQLCFSGRLPTGDPVRSRRSSLALQPAPESGGAVLELPPDADAVIGCIAAWPLRTPRAIFVLVTTNRTKRKVVMAGETFALASGASVAPCARWRIPTRRDSERPAGEASPGRCGFATGRPVRTHPDPVSGPARRARMMKGASGHYTAHPFKGLGFKSD
jgi:hypothetical protein